MGRQLGELDIPAVGTDGMIPTTVILTISSDTK